MVVSRIKKVLNNGSVRTVKAKKNIVAMLLIKGLNIVTNLLMVPLLINVLNSEQYGVWLTISSIVALLSFFDIGIGHGLRNKLAEAIASNNYLLAKSYVSTAYFLLGVFTSAFIILYLSFDHLINWTQILNAPIYLQYEVQYLMKYVIVLLCFNLFFKLINSIIYAFQIPYLAQLSILLGQVLTLIIILIIINLRIDPNLLTLGIILMLAPIIILISLSFYLFQGRFKQVTPSLGSINLDLFKNIFVLGLSFFVVQLTSIIVFQTNNLVIAHLQGPIMVTEYNIAFKYLGITAMAFSIITIPYWSATTDAYINNDYAWIKRSIRRLNVLWFFFILFGFVLLLLSKFAYQIWLGSVIQSNYYILALMLIYNIVQMRWYIYGSILNGMGKIRLQLIITTIETIIHVPLAIWLGKTFGVHGVILSMILISIANGIWPEIQFKKNINGIAKGIWAK